MPESTPLGKVEVGPRSESRRKVDRLESRAARDQSFGHRSLVTAWKKQQEADRAMRVRYANILVAVLIFQVVMLNLFFALIGFRAWNFQVEPWAAQTFVIASFAEISALVLIVARYLFPPATDKVLETIGGLPGTAPKKIRNAGRTARKSGDPPG